MTAVLREPLFHFLSLGAALFGLYALFDDTPPPVSQTDIVITEDDARRLAGEFEAVWRRPPSVSELDDLIDRFVREEVYVREALALGLDRDDAVIRRRLQMKMEFLTETGAEAVQPDDAVLQAHLDGNPERFADPARVAFEQVMLDAAVAEPDLPLIEARLNDGAEPQGVARSSLLPGALGPSPRQVVDGSFGRGFFDALAALPVGAWAGPIDGAFGRHMVRVTSRRAHRVPPLSAIRDRVERDWRGEFAARLREDRFRALLSRYEVARPDAAGVLAP